VPELDRRQLLLLAALAVVVVGLGARLLGSREGAPPAPVQPARAPAVRLERSDARVTVHVAGAVRRPGLYRLRAGARVDDALERAGGATRRADLDAVNLAAEVEDGRQVLVPERGAVAASAGSSTAGSSGAAGGAGGGAASAGGGAASAGGGAASEGAGAAFGAAGPVVNLNTATLEQLDTLQGIGPALAQAIIAYREEHGGFGSVAELAEVPGIGDARMAALEGRVGV